MKKLILSLSVIFMMSSFTSKTTVEEKITVKKVVEVQITAGECVRFARNIVLGYAAGNEMDTTRDSPEYSYLMGLYLMQYENCLEDAGLIN
tara:strand:- start:638 stop:910 length:273 start_codon:yes stop_codon:yes gene_type:complete